jgi:hypothetical protein
MGETGILPAPDDHLIGDIDPGEDCGVGRARGRRIDD